jgi:hypothetical protein
MRLNSGGPALQRLLLVVPRVLLASQLLHIVEVVRLLSPMMRSELVLLPFLFSFLFLVLDAKGEKIREAGGGSIQLN